jgi:hypothetical protein
VLLIVNRDSNDIGFMDLKTKKMVGSTFLGNNVNPHMAMMSPDGRYVVTGGTRANKAFVATSRTHMPPCQPRHVIVSILPSASGEPAGERLMLTALHRPIT